MTKKTEYAVAGVSPKAGDVVELFWATREHTWRRDTVLEVFGDGKFICDSGCIYQVDEEGKTWRWPAGPVGEVIVT